MSHVASQPIEPDMGNMMTEYDLEAGDILPDGDVLIIEGHPNQNLSRGIAAEITLILDDIRRALERTPEGARPAALRLVRLLTPPVAARTAGVRGGLAPWQKRKVDRYLREHLTDPIRLDDLAKQIPLSISYFVHSFKETFGETPHMYIIRLRVERAQKLMLETSDALSQIALACGFADQSHFCKAFRRVLGESPNAWRRRNLADAHVATTAAILARASCERSDLAWSSLMPPSGNPREVRFRKLTEVFRTPGKDDPHSWR